MELTTTTALALGLMCSWPVSAAELELKPTFDNPGVKVASITFLPDWMGEGNSGEIDIDANRDSKWCEQNGFKYYSSGKCPAYYVQETCGRDRKYLKCDGVKWCKNNGYNITSCDSNKHTNGQCPNGLGYYQKCLCNAEYKYNSSNCSGNNRAEGQSCSDVDNPTRYNQCNCYPSAAWSNYSYSCTGTETQYDGCGRYYHRCCSDTCSRGSKNYSGSYAGKTECGSSCYYCKGCSSGSTSYSGSYAGSSECGSCYYCSDTCYSGSKSSSCSSGYRAVRVSSTECGSGCYECQYDPCYGVSGVSCSYGCASYGSCGQCTSCKPNPNPWKYMRNNCRSLMCWSCENSQYCGSYYQNGYAPVYTCDMYCYNTETGAKKSVCSLGGWGIFSAKAATKDQCNANMAGLNPPSGSSTFGNCNSDGTSSCHY